MKRRRKDKGNDKNYAQMYLCVYIPLAVVYDKLANCFTNLHA